MAKNSSGENLPKPLREDFEERAAILEYSAGLTREEAEKRALEMVKDLKARRQKNTK